MKASLGATGLQQVLDGARVIGDLGAVAMILVAALYLVTLLAALSRQPWYRGRAHIEGQPGPEPAAWPMQIVVLMPCLNEEPVIGPSVGRLLDNPDPAIAVLVIDDGSEDATSTIARSIPDPRVSLLRRELPRARQGKGEALNEALQVVRRDYRDLDPARVIVGVLDADGRLDPESWAEVRRAFRPAAVGAVQLGVRIVNRDRSLLARMQDIEFVVFTTIFQGGRRFLGSVGMGGNAQFVRLSALNALGARPWTRSLTEDFDLGIRLNTTRWTNEYWGKAAVHQEGVTSVRRLIRQRTRWFQGNLQARHLLGRIAREMRGTSRADTLWQVLCPYTLLAGSFLTASFSIMLCLSLVRALRGEPQSWTWVPIAYLLAFGPSYLYAMVYRRSLRHHEDSSILRCVAWCHLFVLYGLLPGVYGWRALGREILGRTGWAKTAREAEGTTTLSPDAGRTEASAVDPDPPAQVLGLPENLSVLPVHPPPPPPLPSVPPHRWPGPSRSTLNEV